MPAIRFMLKTSGYRRIWQGFGQIPVSGPLHSTVSYGDPSVAPRLAMICVQESPLKTTPTSNSGSFPGFQGITLWFTGLSGSGKSTVANILVDRLKNGGAKVEVLDGDVVRTNLSKGLGFSKEDRDANIRRIGFVCNLLSRNGVVAIAAAISPYAEIRDEVRRAAENFVEVYVERDPKDLYKKAIAGEIKNFTGVSDPYEAPENAEVTFNSSECTAEEAADKIWNYLVERDLVTA